VPASVFSAGLTVMTDSPEVGAGESVTITASLTNNEDTANAYSGTIAFPVGTNINSITQSSDVVSSWINVPKISGNTIVFDGITVGGFDGREGVLFKVNASWDSEGQKDIRFVDGAVLRNDGTGTNYIERLVGASVVVGSVSVSALPENILVPATSNRSIEAPQINSAVNESRLTEDEQIDEFTLVESSAMSGSSAVSESHEGTFSYHSNTFFLTLLLFFALAFFVFVVYVHFKKSHHVTKFKTYRSAIIDTFSFKKFTKRFFLLSAGISLIVILFFIFLTGLTNYFTTTYQYEVIGQINDKIVTEQEKAEAYFDDVTQDQRVEQYVKQGDMGSLRLLLEEKANQYDVQLSLVVDNDGRALLRLQNKSNVGDYVYTTEGWGPLLQRGDSFSGYGKGKRVPLLYTVGGATESYRFLTGYNLSQEKFDTFVDDNNHIVLFVNGRVQTHSSGLEDDAVSTVKKLFKVSGSSHEELSRETIMINGLHYYYSIEDLKTLGEDEYKIVALIEKPYWAQYSLIMIVTSGITLLLYLIGYYLIARKRFIGPSYFIGVFIFGGLTLAGCAFYVDYLSQKQVQIRDESLFAIYNSTLSFTPESDVVFPDSRQQISVLLDSGGEDLSAIDLEIRYQEGIVVEEVVASGEVCIESFVVRNSIDLLEKVIRFTCVLPGGYTKTGGTIADIYYTLAEETSAEFIFLPQTQIIANDGIGTNVLRTVQNTTVRSFDDMQNYPFVFSTSHPNMSRWYKNRTVELAWSGSEDEKYIIRIFKGGELVQAPVALNDNKFVFVASSDGQYDVEIIDADELIGRYSFAIDTTPPTKPKVLVSSTNITMGELVRLVFTSADSTSGLQQGNFYVSYDNGIYLPVNSPFYTSFGQRGVRQVTVRVYDNAENYSEETIEFTVR
jgi:hypothetical protein